MPTRTKVCACGNGMSAIRCGRLGVRYELDGCPGNRGRRGRVKTELLRLGATHFTFVGPFSKSGHESMLFKCAKLETVAFWGCDAYLEGGPAVKAYLASDALVKFSHGAAWLDMK